MTNEKWDQAREEEFKEIINNFFNDRIETALKKVSSPLEVGDGLADLLKNSDSEVAQIVTPRAVRKWASDKTLPKWLELLRDPQMVVELREIGRSIANSMRPLAGNTFSSWVAKILNAHFYSTSKPLFAITSGKVKTELSNSFIRKVAGESRDYRPDIDIVLVRMDLHKKPVAIISAKTTLAERIMQTISWSRIIKIPLFLVTAWDTFEGGANRDRVQELDGVYVCNRRVKEYGKIKLFSRIVEDLEKLSS